MFEELNNVFVNKASVQAKAARNYRDRDLKRFLPFRGASPASRLRAKMEKCETLRRSGALWFCRSPACVRCRERYIGRECRRLQKRFCNAPNDELAMVSIVLGVTDPRCVEQIGGIWKNETRALRNIVDRARRKGSSFNSLDLTVYLEADLVEEDQMPMLGSRKRQQILNMAGRHSFDGHVWIVTLHGIIRHDPAISCLELESLFASRWKHLDQVDVRPFDRRYRGSANIGVVTAYCLKNACLFTDDHGRGYPWSISRVAELSVAMESMSHSFKSLRKVIGPKRSGLSMSEDCAGMSENPMSKRTDDVPPEGIPGALLINAASFRSTSNVVTSFASN